MIRYEYVIAVFEAFVYLSFLNFFIEREIEIKKFLLAYAIFVVGMTLVRIFQSNILIFLLLSIGSVTMFCCKHTIKLKKSAILGVFITVMNLHRVHPAGWFCFTASIEISRKSPYIKLS